MTCTVVMEFYGGLVLGGPTCIEVLGDLEFWGDLRTHLHTMKMSYFRYNWVSISRIGINQSMAEPGLSK